MLFILESDTPPSIRETRSSTDHTPGGTVIELGAKRVKEDKVRVFVKDNGQGINSQDQKFIFDRFHQVDRQVGDGSKGIGLGLSIARGFVQAHNTELQVESAPDAGAMFYFDLESLN